MAVDCLKSSVTCFTFSWQMKRGKVIKISGRNMKVLALLMAILCWLEKNSTHDWPATILVLEKLADNQDRLALEQVLQSKRTSFYAHLGRYCALGVVGSSEQREFARVGMHIRQLIQHVDFGNQFIGEGGKGQNQRSKVSLVPILFSTSARLCVFVFLSRSFQIWISHSSKRRSRGSNSH